MTLFKSHVRRLQELGMTLAPDFQCVIILMTLSKPFKAFTTNAMMQGNQSLQALYNRTVEYAKIHLPSDEASNKGVVLQTEEITCKFGSNCPKWQQDR